MWSRFYFYGASRYDSVMDTGALNEVSPMRAVLLKHPRQAWHDQKSVSAQWKALGYTAEPDVARACEEFDAFAAILRRHVSQVRFLPAEPATGLDSIYVRDAACLAPRGVVLGRMGKALRRAEPRAVGAFCAKAEWPVAGAIVEPGTLEGGDVVWLDERTVAVGRGYRTNAEGIRQFRELVTPDGCEVIEVTLPHWSGPDDVFHLMSVLSPVAERKLLVHSRLLPVPFRERLLGSGFELLEVPEAEFGTMGGNVLAIASGICLALAGNPLTAEVLDKAGLEVLTYEGREISLKGAGGPTCLTRPVRR